MNAGVNTFAGTATAGGQWMHGLDRFGSGAGGGGGAGARNNDGTSGGHGADGSGGYIQITYAP